MMSHPESAPENPAAPSAQELSEAELSSRPEDFLVVGIGASAGGVQALRSFFEGVPDHSGIAYVVILHLSPDHDSKLAEILQTVTAMPVIRVMEQVLVQPDHVYVIPPDQHLMMDAGSLAVMHNTSIEDRRAPVDIFFRTLAESHRSRAVGVILSGTGANGSMGIKRIKERGGAAFVQDPNEAEYDEMPLNSIATELIDDILPVAQIPGKIIAYQSSQGSVIIPDEADQRAEDHQQVLREILTLLRTRTGHDFSNYKRPTLLRRIERRINVRNLPHLQAYIDYLREHQEEASALLKDLLISVTNFFRDRKAFDAIEQEILPELLRKKQKGTTVRVWVVGCATGEEAYSLAMLLAERTFGNHDVPGIQIFASDIDEAALRHAREGLYTLNDAADVSAERLQRFFVREGDQFRIRPEIREMIMFANHNVLKDPPFSHLDMVSCRNMLIYLNGVAQERAMETFHFALDTGGYLFLGTSESAESVSDLFTPVNREQHIFQSRPVGRRQFPVPESVPVFRFEKTHGLDISRERKATPARITYADLHQQLLEEYAPPSVVINEAFDIMHLSARAGRYLQVGGGELSQNLLKLIRPELRLELRTALYQAQQRGEAVQVGGLKLMVDDRPEVISLQIRPVLRQGDNSRGFILVLFQPVDGPEEGDRAPHPVNTLESGQLEEELMQARDRLYSAIEHHELQAEELKSSNEELQAMNEELRSATEELETSKEELQSINEELTTVNQELKVKVEELSLSNNNLQNLINSTAIGTIFLDRSLRVVLFTPAAREIFNLIPADFRRPLSDITSKLEYDSLQEDAARVLDRLLALQREVRTTDGKVFLMRILPYRTQEDRITGVVLTFLDITERKLAEQELAEDLKSTTLLHELGTRLSLGRDIQTLYMEILAAASELTGGDAGTLQTPAGAGHELAIVAARGVDGTLLDGLRLSLSEASGTSRPDSADQGRFIDLARHPHAAQSATRMLLEAGFRSAQALPLIARSGKAVGLLTTYWRRDFRPAERALRSLELLARQAADLIEQRQSDEALRKSEAEFRTVTDLVPELLWSNDANGAQWWRNKRWQEYTGQLPEESAGNGWIEAFHPEEQQALLNAMETGKPLRLEQRIRQVESGEYRWFLVQVQPLLDATGGVRRWYAAAADMHELRTTLDAQRENEDRFRLLADTVPQVIWGNDADGKATYFNQRWFDYSGRSLEESLGPGWQAIVHRDDAKHSVASWKDALATGRVFDAEFRLRRHDGVYRWFIGRNVPLLNKAGRVVGWFGSATDIEELKLAQQSLRESEERLRVTMESAIDYAIITTDIDHRVQAWSAGAERIFGYREEEVIEKPIDFIFVPEDVAAGVPLREMHTAREVGRAIDERWHQRRDGSRFFMIGVMAPIYNPALTGYVKVARDMTDEQRAAEALREAEERQRIVLEAAELGTWDWNLVTGEIIWNEQHYRLMGRIPEDSVIRIEEFLGHIYPEDLDLIRGPLDRAIEAPGAYQAEFRIVRVDNGSIRWMSSYGKATRRDEDGRATRMTGVMYDITQRKETEQRKEEFLGVASHELKTPITSIKAYAELLQDMFLEAGDPQTAEVLGKLDYQIDRLTNLTKYLLDATRINEGRLELEPVSLDINEVVREATEEMQRMTDKHELKLELEPVPPVLADRERIVQVFNNILSNAIKYSPASDTVVIRTLVKDQQVLVCVRDYGVGLSEEAAARVFDRFYRSSDPTIRTYPGMGLGLYIAAEIVKLHKGTIWVESRKGEGANFCFSLPAGA